MNRLDPKLHRSLLSSVYTVCTRATLPFTTTLLGSGWWWTETGGKTAGTTAFAWDNGLPCRRAGAARGGLNRQATACAGREGGLAT
jgi:hypothetical protein